MFEEPKDKIHQSFALAYPVFPKPIKNVETLPLLLICELGTSTNYLSKREAALWLSTTVSPGNITSQRLHYSVI